MTKKLARKGRQIIAKKSREPVIDTASENVDLDLVNALHWYNLNRNKKDSRKYLIEYLKSIKYPKKNLIDIMYSDDNDIPLNVGWLCRIKKNNENFQFDEKKQQYIDRYLSVAIKKGIKAKENKKKNKQSNTKSVRDYLNDSIQKILSEVEEKIDDVVFYENTDKFDIHSFLIVNNAKKPHVDAITDKLKKEHSELVLAQKGLDEEIVEGYSHIPKRRLNFLVKLYEELITECVKYLNTNQSVVRKKRKKKLKTPEQIVKKFKFQVECNDLNIKSLSPEKIIGAKELWTYNTKNKKLSHFISTVEGFSVKGTTLLNFEEEQSLEKVIRKPKEIIQEFETITKTRAKKLFEELSTKEKLCNGRFNENTIILKIFK
jgi:hypothetical protein